MREIETIIIDKNYPGVHKNGFFYVLTEELWVSKADVQIKIPLICTKFIRCKSLSTTEELKVQQSLEVMENIYAKSWVEVDGALTVYGSINIEGYLKVSGWFEVKGSIKVEEFIKVDKGIEVGGSLEVEEWLSVNQCLKVGGSLAVFGKKTSKYLKFETSLYDVIITNTHIKIGCKEYPIEKWEKFSDKQILKLDGKKALVWWNQWKEFILLTHKNLPETYSKGKK